MVDIWTVHRVVFANMSICEDASHDLHRYLDLMMRIEAATRCEISEADKLDRNDKSIKLPGLAMGRMYLAGQGTNSPLQFFLCAKCGHPLASHHLMWIILRMTRYWRRTGRRIIIVGGGQSKWRAREELANGPNSALAIYKYRITRGQSPTG